MGEGVVERTKALAETQPTRVRFLGHGQHFSSNKSPCPENKCRHPPPVIGRYLRVPNQKFCQTQHTSVKTLPLQTLLPKIIKPHNQLMSIVAGL